ncbi:hypothetical protein K438DRAFT_1758659 [Mycena galopus ATCC 62051]|nr:hypothetical protein K438DRAFT_1758659 [Mycena galopus ATCC 62051]
MYVVRYDLSLSAELAYGWLCATTTFSVVRQQLTVAQIYDHCFCAQLSSTPGSPRRRAARHLDTPHHLDAGLATSTRGLGPQRRARHMDVGLGTSELVTLTPSSGPRCGARDLNVGLATSIRSSPPRCGVPHLDFDAGLATLTRGSPHRLAPRHIVTRLATSSRTSPLRHAPHQQDKPTGSVQSSCSQLQESTAKLQAYYTGYNRTTGQVWQNYRQTTAATTALCQHYVNLRKLRATM